MTEEGGFKINVWINEERFQELTGDLQSSVQEVLAGLKVLRVPATVDQKDELLQRFPAAKCDTSTTRTIELLPRAVKDQLFRLMVENQSVDVLDAFLAQEA